MNEKILLHPHYINVIMKEFNTSRQTVYTSLSYYNNSELAIAIRNRAKQKLIEEATKI